MSTVGAFMFITVMKFLKCAGFLIRRTLEFLTAWSSILASASVATYYRGSNSEEQGVGNTL